jgi:hypothetical protein
MLGGGFDRTGKHDPQIGESGFKYSSAAAALNRANKKPGTSRQVFCREETRR